MNRGAVPNAVPNVNSETTVLALVHTDPVKCMTQSVPIAVQRPKSRFNPAATVQSIAANVIRSVETVSKHKTEKDSFTFM